jgi:metal-responsive CopG/Arc/MetJ family transcriptional regulator
MLYSNKKDIDGIPCYLENHFGKKRSSFIKHVQRNTLEQRNLQQRKSRSTHCPMSNMTTEERIHLYQQKYIHIIAAETQLRTWIKSSKQKGPPLPLLKRK